MDSNTILVFAVGSFIIIGLLVLFFGPPGIDDDDDIPWWADGWEDLEDDG